jgi:hypothetical protein
VVLIEADRITVDCPDAALLAAFWERCLDRSAAFEPVAFDHQLP